MKKLRRIFGNAARGTRFWDEKTKAMVLKILMSLELIIKICVSHGRVRVELICGTEVLYYRTGNMEFQSFGKLHTLKRTLGGIRLKGRGFHLPGWGTTPGRVYMSFENLTGVCLRQ